MRNPDVPIAPPPVGFPVAVACFVALWKYKADIIKVIGACALLGLGHSFFM